MGDLLFFLVGWWLAGCLATFLTCGWVARAVWLVGKMAGCLWQGWEGGLYFYNFMAAPWDGRRSQSRKPLSFRQKSWKRKKTIQLTIGDGLHSYPSMDVPTICFCRMLVNWPMNIIIIIIFFIIIIIIIIVLLVSLAHFHLSFSMSRKVHRKLQHNFSTRAIQKETSWDSQARAMEKETS